MTSVLQVVYVALLMVVLAAPVVEGYCRACELDELRRLGRAR